MSDTGGENRILGHELIRRFQRGPAKPEGILMFSHFPEQRPAEIKQKCFIQVERLEPAVIAVCGSDIDHQTTSWRLRVRPLVDDVDVRVAWQSGGPRGLDGFGFVEVCESENLTDDSVLELGFLHELAEDIHFGKQYVRMVVAFGYRGVGHEVRWQFAAVQILM